MIRLVKHDLHLQHRLDCRFDSILIYIGLPWQGYVNSVDWNGGMEWWSGLLDWTTGVPRPQVDTI